MTDCTELKRLAEACVAAGEYLPGEAWAEDRGYCPAEVAFLEFAPVATPAAVLALIADNDRLREDPGMRAIRSLRGDCADLIAERDQLKAENEALKSDCRRLRSDITAWRLTVTAERANRDAYKSELERLTGTAFAEELAALRKDAEKWKIVQHAMDELQSDERNASIWTVCSRLLISTAHKLNSAVSTVTEEGVTIGEEEIGDWRVTVERIDAALGQGEQS